MDTDEGVDALGAGTRGAAEANEALQLSKDNTHVEMRKRSRAPAEETAAEEVEAPTSVARKKRKPQSTGKYASDATARSVLAQLLGSGAAQRRGSKGGAKAAQSPGQAPAAPADEEVVSFGLSKSQRGKLAARQKASSKLVKRGGKGGSKPA